MRTARVEKVPKSNSKTEKRQNPITIIGPDSPGTRVVREGNGIEKGGRKSLRKTSRVSGNYVAGF